MISQNKATLIFLVRVLLGGTFAFLGGFKLLQSPDYYQFSLYQVQLFPDLAVPYIAIAVPWFELIFGTFLILGMGVSHSAYSLSFISALFQLTIGQSILRRLPIVQSGFFGGEIITLTQMQAFLLGTIIIVGLLQIALFKNHIFALDVFFSRKHLRK